MWFPFVTWMDDAIIVVCGLYYKLDASGEIFVFAAAFVV